MDVAHSAAANTDLDLAALGRRAVNRTLIEAAGGQFTVTNPSGAHALACGLMNPVEVDVVGSTGYYCAGMNKAATVHVHGSAGPGVAENMISGKVIIDGDASQYAGATSHGGILVIRGNAASRCGIS
ncbi:MAG: protein GlxC, partial [Pseudomonadota bacterium]